MDLEQVLKRIEERGISRVKVGGFDIDGVLRGKSISTKKFESAARDGFGFCDVIFGWDCGDVLYDKGKFTGWHTGYPDALARMDLSTYREVPWEQDTALLLVDFYETPEKRLAISPRTLLRDVVDRAVSMGFTPKASFEFEFFFFKETPDSLQQKGFQGLQPLSPGMFGYSVVRASANSELVESLMRQMRAYGCEIEGIHTETGPGVYEVALHYDGALEAADRAALFKTGVKELAARLGLTACFMAKWNASLPGCSGHIHQSLWDKGASRPSFAEGPKGQHGMSRTMEHYIAGQLAAMRECTALVAPTVNSYKRLVPGTWAPTHVTWGFENRTTSLRAITGPSPKSTRVEYRLAGADINPYIALAATLGAGLYGVRNELSLGAPVRGNAYTDAGEEAQALPRSLEEAVELLDRSELARDILGEEFIEHYVVTRRWEVAQYQRAVTNWELARYLEII